MDQLVKLHQFQIGNRRELFRIDEAKKQNANGPKNREIKVPHFSRSALRMQLRQAVHQAQRGHSFSP